MEVIKTNIEGVVIIEPRLFKDDRGDFFESFSQREFDEKVRPIKFVQYVLVWSDEGAAFSNYALQPK